MTCYSAGHDLRWGVRVASAHRDGRVVLYNIPSDLFRWLQNLRTSVDIWDETSGVFAQSDLMMDDVLTAHPNSIADPALGNEASQTPAETSLRTVQVEGVEIGHVGREMVDDLVVMTQHGGVRVWVFCRSGIGKLFDIYVPPGHSLRSRYVSVDGPVHDEEEDAIQTRSQEADSIRPRSPKGKERAHEDAEQEPKHHNYFSDMDGTCEIELDTPGGVWIDDSDTRRRRADRPRQACVRDHHPMPNTWLQVQVSSSAIGDDGISFAILADELAPGEQEDMDA
jgi:hypothetical protein